MKEASSGERRPARPGLTRRRFALAAGGSALLAGCASPRGPAGSTPAADRDDAVAWIDRLTWGVDGAALAEWSKQSRDGFLEAQLHPDAGPALSPEVQSRVDALGLNQRSAVDWVVAMNQRRRDADALPDIEARRAAQQAYQQALTSLSRDAGAQFLFHALYSRHQLREQLTWFWFNHFNVHQYKGPCRALVGDYQAQLRSRALGRFQDLLIASATHPAMIIYLDNEANAANRINENFAREVMELHTLGVDAGYSQKDVQELARVMTGLTANFTDKTPTLKPAQQALYRRQGATEFNPARHDMGTKQVLGVAVEGRGFDEILDELVRLAKHPATARHVSRQLAVFFCADAPDPALVDRMSQAFTASDGRIDATLQALFDARAFRPSLGRKFKDPVHYVVSAVRLAYDGRTVLNTAPMQGWIDRLGEGLYNRQTPDGYPLDEAAWSASGQMGTRFEVARAIGSGSAGLFRPSGATADVPAFPQMSNAAFHGALAPTLGADTLAALGAATSPQEWNVLLLSSPEFMFR